MDSLLGKLGRHAGRLRSAVLTLGGFGAITYSAFQYSWIAGWAAVGISCFAIDWYSDKTDKAPAR